MTHKRHLLTLYTRTPLHVGSGNSVDVVDLPIMRERITGFPVIPSTSLKGVLLQRGRELWPSTWKQPKDPRAKPKEILHQNNQLLFGAINSVGEGENEEQVSNAGCVQIMEAKLLAFPVRSLAGCFAWVTCPTALHRFNRDTDKVLLIPEFGEADKDKSIAGSELIVKFKDNKKGVVFEEYALDLKRQLEPDKQDKPLVEELSQLTDDPVWKQSKEPMARRLAIIHDEQFQHLVTTCTEIMTRIAINPETRTVKGSAGEGGGALFNQENVPCETLFYSVLTILQPRSKLDGLDEAAASIKLGELLTDGLILQIGGDETTGHGFCRVKRQELAKDTP